MADARNSLRTAKPRPHCWSPHAAFGLVCAIVTVTVFPGAALAQSALDGKWSLVRNRYKSDVELRFEGNGLSATIGCLDVGYRVETSGSAFSADGDLVRQASCRLSEMRNPAAYRYWHRIQEQIDDATEFEIRKDRLSLVGPSGTLTFKRKP